MHIVYITNGMSSTLNSSFEWSRRLVTAGHRVSYLSPAPIADRVAAHGYAFEQLTRDREFRDRVGETRLSWRGIVKPLAWMREVRHRRRVRQESIANDEIETVVRELAPDALAIDIEMHFAVLATVPLQIPTVLPIVWFSIFRRPGLPPMHTPSMPASAVLGSSLVGRLKELAAWWKLRLATAWIEWRQRVVRALKGDFFRPVSYETFDIDDLRAVANCRGLRLGELVSRAHWLRPFVYRRLPVVCFNVLEMEFPHEPHPQMHYVGPMVHRKRREAQLDSRSVAQWQRFVESRETAIDSESRRPLIYCSLGTFWSADESFLRQVLAVFERRSDWQLVLGLGGKLEAEALAPVPDNALVIDFAPQLEVLALSDCAITHGGITTIDECIEFEVPMVVYSTHHVDQDGCAARVAFHHLGVVGDKECDGVDELERNIEQVLTDPTIRDNVVAMRRRFLEYRQPDRAVALIEGAPARGQESR